MIEGTITVSFCEACIQKHLLTDDSEYIDALTEVLKQIDDQIQSFPAIIHNNSQHDNAHKVYLPNLSVSAMHELYLQEYELSVYDERKAGGDSKSQVTYTKYQTRFNTKFNISFAHPRTDTCTTCDEIEIKLKCADSTEKDSLLHKKELHLRKSEQFYSSLKEDSRISKCSNNICTLACDFQQNLPISIFYLRQLWLYVST